jgi:hypothetical protein
VSIGALGKALGEAVGVQDDISGGCVGDCDALHVIDADTVIGIDDVVSVTVGESEGVTVVAGSAVGASDELHVVDTDWVAGNDGMNVGDCDDVVDAVSTGVGNGDGLREEDWLQGAQLGCRLYEQFARQLRLKVSTGKLAWKSSGITPVMLLLWMLRTAPSRSRVVHAMSEVGNAPTSELLAKFSVLSGQ